jgi:hypothetical protein
MLSRGNDFRRLRDAKLPDTRNHRSKVYVAAGATCPENEAFIGPGSCNRSRYLRRRRCARRAPSCCAVLPIVRGRDTAVVACWLRKGSTAVVIGHDILSTYRRFLRGQSRQGFAKGMFVSRRGRNRRCAKAGGSRFNRASLYAEAPVMHPDAIATGALGLRRCCGYGALQFFVQVFLRGWIDGDVFSWKIAARLA